MSKSHGSVTVLLTGIDPDELEATIGIVILDSAGNTVVEQKISLDRHHKKTIEFDLGKPLLGF